MENTTLNILPFRQWCENEVQINFILDKGARIESLQSKKYFETVTEPLLVTELIINPKPKLLSVYKQHFEWIQKQHTKLLQEFDEYDRISV